MIRMQHCGNCGEKLGMFEHRYRDDGPLSCGQSECNRAAREEEQIDRETAMELAAEDDFGRYR